MASPRLKIFEDFRLYLGGLSDTQKKTEYTKRLGEAMHLHELAQNAAFGEDEVYEPLKANADRAANDLSSLMTSGGRRRRRSSCKPSRRRHRRSRRASRRAH